MSFDLHFPRIIFISLDFRKQFFCKKKSFIYILGTNSYWTLKINQKIFIEIVINASAKLFCAYFTSTISCHWHSFVTPTSHLQFFEPFISQPPSSRIVRKEEEKWKRNKYSLISRYTSKSFQYWLTDQENQKILSVFTSSHLCHLHIFLSRKICAVCTCNSF